MTHALSLLSRASVKQALSACLVVILASGWPAQSRAEQAQPKTSGGKSACQESGGPNIGNILGGVAGGLLGSQMGKGDGKTAATLGGALFGGLVGGEAQKQLQKPDCKTSDKTKQKPKPKTQEAAKPAPAKPETAKTASDIAGVPAVTPAPAAASQDQAAATLQSQYAAAKALYDTHPVYRQRIDRTMAEALGNYDAALERDTQMETQFRESGLLTPYDARIGEIRTWVASNRSDISSMHMELADKLRELNGLKRQQANDWSRQAAQAKSGTTQAANPVKPEANGQTTASQTPESPISASTVAQIGTGFSPDDTDELLKKKRRFFYDLVKAGTEVFDLTDPAYLKEVEKLQADYPEFRTDIQKMVADTGYYQDLVDDFYADNKARLMTDDEYKKGLISAKDVMLNNFDQYEGEIAKNDLKFKSKNFTTKYDAPINALRDKIAKERGTRVEYFTLIMDIAKYTNLVNWRIDEWNAHLVETGYSANSAPLPTSDQDVIRMVDNVLIADSKSWVMHRYDQHSVKNVKITKSDANGHPAVIHADFSYNQGERGWVDLHYKGTKLSCVTFFDFPGTCRALGNSPGAAIATGIILEMMDGGGSSGSSGGGFCDQNPGARQCGGGSYEPGYVRSAPPVAPIDPFYGSNHTPW